MRSTASLLLALIAAGATSVASTTAPVSTTETAQFFKQHNSQRVKIRYGPFTTDSMDVNNGMADFERAFVQMPCTDCLITWMQAGLEYANGTDANADTNFWLHHTVFANLNRTSTVCPGPESWDQFFASGNERTPVNICVNGTVQAGYYVAPGDTFGMLAELMNMAMTAQTGYVTMTYEFIPKPPSSFSQTKVLWLDIGGCDSSSDQPVKSTTQAFQYTSPDWVSDLSGKITFIAGHLHDGGTHLEVRRNGTDDSDCVATYGANSAYIGGGMSMSMSMSTSMTMSMSMDSTMSMSMPATSTSSMAMPSGSMSMGLMDNVHISNMTCSKVKTDEINPGDNWTIVAHYDPTKHDLMMDTNGTAAPIMGIALVFVADMNATTVSAGTNGTTTTGSSSSGTASTSSSSSGTASSSPSSTASSSSAGKTMEGPGIAGLVSLALMILVGMWF